MLDIKFVRENPELVIYKDGNVSEVIDATTIENYDDLIKEIIKVVDDFYGKDIKNNNEFGRIINNKHMNRLKNILECESVIIATGGLSYPRTGSTGDGYKFAKSLGHTITELKGSLVPLRINSPFIPRLMGLSLKNISIKVLLLKSKQCPTS